MSESVVVVEVQSFLVAIDVLAPDQVVAIDPNGDAGVALSVDQSAAASTAVDLRRGQDGKSAYDLAVEHGFEGTEAEWLEAIGAPRVEYDFRASSGYYAAALVGSEESAGVWSIRRVTQVEGVPVVRRPNGSASFSYAWTLRDTYSYE